MHDVCGTEPAACHELVASTKQTAGASGVDELEQCYEEADSCAGAAGCQAALGIKGAASAVGEFLDAFSDQLKDGKPDD